MKPKRRKASGGLALADEAETMNTSMRDYLIEVANEFQNNFLSIQGFAEYHGLTDSEADTLVKLAQAVRSQPHPES